MDRVIMILNGSKLGGGCDGEEEVTQEHMEMLKGERWNRHRCIARECRFYVATI